MSSYDDKVYVNTVGTAIELDCFHDVSGAVTRQILVKKPSGNTAVWDATQVLGSLTRIEHITQAGDLDEIGTYKLMAKVVFPLGGWDGPGNTTALTVYDLFT